MGLDLGVGLGDDGERVADDGHEAVGHAGERHAIDLARDAAARELEVAQHERRRARLGRAARRGDQQIGKRRLGDRHGHRVRAGHAQQRQHVGQRAADAALVLGHRDQRQAHLLDLLPEIGRPHALLDAVHDVLAAAPGEEAVGGLEQHGAGVMVHGVCPLHRSNVLSARVIRRGRGRDPRVSAGR